MRAKLISILLITLLTLSSCKYEHNLFLTDGLNSYETCNNRLKKIHILINLFVYDSRISNYDSIQRRIVWDEMKTNGEDFIKKCSIYLSNSCFNSIANGIRYSQNPNVDNFYNNIYEVDFYCSK